MRWEKREIEFKLKKLEITNISEIKTCYISDKLKFVVISKL